MPSSHRLRRSSRALAIFVFMASLVALACACGSTKSTDAAGTGKAESGAPAKGGALLSEKLKIEGRQAFSIKPKDDGAKLVGDADQELARYKSEKGGFRIKGPDDAALAEIEVKGDEIRVVRAGATVYELKRYPDGDWKLKDASKAEVFHVKKRDGAAFEVEDAKGARVAKVDVNAAGKTKVKDASGVEIWVAKDRVGPAALACLAFDGVDLPIRVGLLLAVDRF